VPLLLETYGGFGEIDKPKPLKNEVLIWCQHFKGLYVWAHIRGSGDRGSHWQYDGKGLKKINSIMDLVRSAEYFQKLGITDPAHTAIKGGLNGGMTVSGAVTQRPEIFGAVIDKVPVTDMLRFQHFTFGNSWLAEYGDSKIGRHIRPIL
jgi:prolyl oligopeptidase